MPRRTNRLLLATLSALLVFGCAGSDEEGESSSRGVDLEALPAAARATIQREAGSNPIEEIEEKVVDGKTLYEAAFREDGGEVELMVSPAGEIVFQKGRKTAAKAAPPTDDGFRSTFDVDKSKLKPTGSHNPYFILVPGHRIHLGNDDEEVIVSVLDETKTIDGVETRIVEERESENGELVEISRNYFAIHEDTGDVYYFGEHVDDYEGGKVVGHSGQWISGEDGARFGLGLPANPKVGQKYYQEVAPGLAMDRAEVKDLAATFDTPLRSFEDVLYIEETTPLEPEISLKWYAKGIGMIGDDDLRVVKVESASP